MGQAEKAGYYHALKNAGFPLDRHYREYTEKELADTWALVEQDLQKAEGRIQDEPDKLSDELVYSDTPVDELPGARMYGDEEVLRIDSAGRRWYKEEIRKASIPKPRVRRKLTYIDSGFKERTISSGDYTETFEVAGDKSRQGEVRITLPTYQVGKYRDPRYPFAVHVYNNRRGFDLFEVEKFYGGRDLVPEGVKKVYIDSVLCYDIRSTIREIKAEARRLNLSGV